jgi:acyl-CoA thioester hydrolase
LAERDLPKVEAAGSNPVSRSNATPKGITRTMTDPIEPAEGASIIDPWQYSATIPVRQYELDVLGHVNNAVYLNWAEQVAIDHVERLGFGRAWSIAQGGAWVVREHHVTYHLPVEYGDVVTVTTLPQELGGVRGLRRTEIRRQSDGALTTEITTVWVWVRAGDGRPSRVPEELARLFRR